MAAMNARIPENTYAEGRAFGTHAIVSSLGRPDEMRRVIAAWWNDQARPGTCHFAAGCIDSITDWLVVHGQSTARYGERQT